MSKYKDDAPSEDRATRFAPPVDLDRWLMNPDVLTVTARRVAKRRGSATAGVDGVVGHDLSPFASRALAVQLASEWRHGTYRPNSLRQVFRRRGGKVRRFKVATMRDRIVQTALLSALEPHIARSLAPTNYGVRGAGAVLAVSDAVAALRAAHSLVAADQRVHIVKADVADYFDAISHAKLLELIGQICCGRRVRRFIVEMLRRGQSRPGHGLAQGAPLSPLFANLYLNAVDWFFHRRQTLFYCRYVDDILIVVPDTSDRVLANFHELERQVHRLGLELNPEKTFVTPATEGVDFLGFRLRIGPRGVEVTPNERSVTRLQRRLKAVPADGNTSVNLHAAKDAWAAYFIDLVPEAWALGDRLVADEQAVRLLRRPVAPNPVGTFGR